MSLLKNYLSQSTNPVVTSTEEWSDTVEVPTPVPVTPEEDVEAQDALDEVVEERIEERREEERRAHAIEEGEALAESLENFIEVLSHGLETNEYSPQFAAAAGLELRRVHGLFGKAPEETVSFEDYGHDQLEGFYTESLEGFKEAVASVKQSIISVASSTTNYLSELGTNEKAAKALTVRADALTGKLSDFEGKHTVSLGGLGKTFTQGGNVPSNLNQALAGDIKALSTLASKHTKTAVDYYVMTINAVSAAVNNPTKQDEVVKKLIGEKTPNQAMGSLSLLGKTLHQASKPTSRVNSKAVEELFVRLTEEASIFDQVKKADGNVELGKADIEGLVKAAKGYAAIMTLLNREAKKEMERQSTLDKDVLDAAKKQGRGDTTSFNPATIGGAAGSVIGASIVLGGPLIPTAIAALAMGGAAALYTTRTGSVASKDDADVTVRQLAGVLKLASKLPRASFKAIGNRAESNARACLQLAERALAAKEENVAASDVATA